MASLELIQEFQKKNKVVIDGENIKLNIGRFLTQYQDQETREAKIKAFAMGMYPEIANKFEREKMTSVHYHSSEPITTTSLEFFEEYMNIMSELAKEASENLTVLANENIEKAQSAVKKAQEIYDDIEKKHNSAVSNFEKNNPNGDKDINDNVAYKPIKKDYDVAKMNLDIMLERERKALIPPVLLGPTKKYFGMTAAEAKSLLEAQVNSYNYMDERRTQMETVGVRFEGFMDELNNAFKNEDLTYENANAGQKRGIQEVYATKKLMNEQLQSKVGNGIFSWFWKIWYRKDVAAINNYIDAADKALGKVKFLAENEKEAEDALTKQGYFYNEYKASNAETFFAENLAENIVQEKKEEIENKEKQEVSVVDSEKLAKLSEIDANRDKDIDAAEKKDELSKMFDIRFRPPVDNGAFNDQIKIGNIISKELVHGNKKLDPIAKAVFNTNMKKMIDMKEYLDKVAAPKRKVPAEQVQKAFDEMVNKFDQTEREFIYQNPNYVPLTYTDIEKAMMERESVAAEVAKTLNEGESTIAKSQPTEHAPNLQKEGIKKDN